MKVSDEEEKGYKEKKKEYEKEDENMDPFEAAVTANMVRHNFNLDYLVRMCLSMVELMGGERGRGG